MECRHNHCGACCGGDCGNRYKAVELTEAEVILLNRLAQIPFLPVAKQPDSDVPVCLDATVGENCVGVIYSLQNKGLIRLDYDMPLINYAYQEYAQFSCCGSMALTARGQAVLELMEIQGIEE